MKRDEEWRTTLFYNAGGQSFIRMGAYGTAEPYEYLLEAVAIAVTRCQSLL